MLQAVDRANKSLDTLLRAAGVIGGDGSVTVNIEVDNRRKAEAILANLSVEELRALTQGPIPIALAAPIEGEAVA